MTIAAAHARDGALSPVQVASTVVKAWCAAVRVSFASLNFDLEQCSARGETQEAQIR